MAWLAGSGRSDAVAFLSRVVRLDPGAVARLRPGGEGAVTLWSRLPWGVLVSRALPATVPGDRTFSARDLLASVDGELPASRDTDWHWSLPAGAGEVVERIPAADVARIGEAAERTVRAAAAEGIGGRPVGSRMLRDALLDHVPITVTTEGDMRVPISQRLVQAVVRMGFTAGAPGDLVDVRILGPWTALACAYGSAWHRGDGSRLIG
ncbi:hypothetical protein [Dactylosporangium darangshiense]|uniref:Uncharacterized protein n=1 Tax=Dactylosporangium darangshiense TaxID=579108 RepID=A0ABP8DTW8_9ACTN